MTQTQQIFSGGGMTASQWTIHTSICARVAELMTGRYYRHVQMRRRPHQASSAVRAPSATRLNGKVYPNTFVRQPVQKGYDGPFPSACMAPVTTLPRCMALLIVGLRARVSTTVTGTTMVRCTRTVAMAQVLSETKPLSGFGLCRLRTRALGPSAGPSLCTLRRMLRTALRRLPNGMPTPATAPSRLAIQLSTGQRLRSII